MPSSLVRALVLTTVAVSHAASRQCSTPVKGVVIGSKAFAHVPATNFSACCSQCAAEPLCVAFTFEFEEGKCFLKSDVFMNVTKDSALSGTVPLVPPPAPTPPPPPSPPTHTQFSVSSAQLRNIVDPNFKSWNIDASPNRQWNTRDLSDPVLRSLARQSLPGFLRFGGSGNDGLGYARDMGNASAAGNMCVHPDSKQCLNRTWFDNLCGFADAAGAKLVFGLSMPQNRSMPPGYWDTGDARALIEYAISAGHKFYGFELGNEQNTVFTAEEAARNFAALATLLEELYPDAATRPKLIGPDVHGFHEAMSSDDEKLEYLVHFAGNCSQLGVPLHALTHHEYIEVPQYPVAPANATLLDTTAQIAAIVNRTLSVSAQGVQIWAGEIGPHNGKSPGCDHDSLRWANWGDTFWYMDAMGSKAANGYSAFCRQDFVGIDYGMLDCATHTPLPDYFGGLLWSKLMGTGVLWVAPASNVSESGSNDVRAYAHCAPASLQGATALLMNLNPSAPAWVSLGQFGGESSTREEWHLTGPNGTSAAAVALNGKQLEYKVDSKSGEALLPPLGGRVVARSPAQDDVVMLSPASIAFVHVSDGAAAAMCSKYSGSEE